MAILGIDEVGRGPLAGPLVVGAVILPEEKPDWAAELKDSKKLLAKKREKLNEVILMEAAATGLGWVEPAELDEIGISQALKLATRRAVETVQNLHVAFSQIVIDGKINFLQGTRLEKYVSTMVKADDLVKEVSAASIIAKVARDNYMVKLTEKYPEYGFETHVGYGTAKHLAAIREFGICPEHRRSFEPIKSMVGFERPKKNVVEQNSSASQGAVKNTTSIGNKAEDKVAECLVQKGHKIVARNYKTKVCEIDIVSVLNDKLYFTEVKYRKNDRFGGGLAAINAAKQQKMKFAAEVFLKGNIKYGNMQPLLAVADVVGDDYVVKDWFWLTV
jgi:ribonuclease HII